MANSLDSGLKSRVYTTALVGREKTTEGFRWRFRDDEGIDAWVRDLAEREQACCAFFSFTVTRTGGEVRLDGVVTPEEVDARFTRHGLQVLRASG